MKQHFTFIAATVLFTLAAPCATVAAGEWNFDTEPQEVARNAPSPAAAPSETAQLAPEVEFPDLAGKARSPLRQGGEYLKDIGKVSSDVADLPEETVKDVQGAIDKAQATSPAAARAYAEHLRDQERQAELKKGKAEVLQELFREAFSQGASQESIEDFVKVNAEAGEYENKKLLVFISSELPDAVMSNFLNALGNNSQTAFVLRGVVDNDISKIMPTQKWVKDKLCPGGDDAATCFQAPIDINPELFTRFNITHVPAVVYVSTPDVLLASCDGPVEVTEEDYLTYYGDFSPYKSITEFLKVRPSDPALNELAKLIMPQDWHDKKRNTP